MYEDEMISFDAARESILYNQVTRASVARMLDQFGQIYVSDYEDRNT
jgi:hypothetical protein